MLEFILLMVGIVKALQRPELIRLTVQDFPNVDPKKFNEWHQAQLKATDIFLWATWGAFLVKSFIGFVTSGRLSPEGVNTLLLIIIGGWIAGLIVAHLHSGKANKLRLEAGINWPKQAGNK